MRVAAERRDAFRDALAKEGVGTGIHYPVPIHEQEAAKFLGYRKGDLPVTERIAREVVSLPMYAELTDAQVEAVADAAKKALRA